MAIKTQPKTPKPSNTGTVSMLRMSTDPKGSNPAKSTPADRITAKPAKPSTSLRIHEAEGLVL